MASFLDVCRFTAVSNGTGDFVVSAAVTGYQTPASAAAVNGATYRYRAESATLTEWEVGYGVYTTGSVTLARTTVLFNSAGTTAKISFSAAPQVGLVALAEDLIFINPPQGRLTLVTATPVMATSQSAKTTIFYTPYIGNQIPLYDGVSFRNVAFSELSNVTGNSASGNAGPAAVAISSVYDLFVWQDSAGANWLTRGPLWTNDTTRSAGTALVMVNGILLNNAAITNGPAASRGTYVGTVRSNGSAQIDWIFGASAAGGTAAWFGVWNMYNRVDVNTTVNDSTASWLTATSATYGPMNVGATGGGLNNRISAVFGLPEDGIRISVGAIMAGIAVAFSQGNIGFALDATNVADKIARSQSTSSGLAVVISGLAQNNYAPQTGFHFWQAVNAGDGTNTGSIAGGLGQGLSGEFRM